MANNKSSIKRISISNKRRKHNASRRSAMRTAIRKVYIAIKLKDKETAKKLFKTAQSILDKYSTKGLLHKNKAARHKSIMQVQIKKLL